MKQLPIPADLWDEIVRFIESRPYGWVRLNLKDGQVLSISKYEDVRPVQDSNDGKNGNGVAA